MAGVGIRFLVISHVFALADVLFKAPLFPFLIALWFDVCLLSGFTQIFICFFTFVSGICGYTGITKPQFRFHIFEEWHQSPHIVPVLENLCRHNVFAVYCDLDIIARFQLGIPHMVIFHVHKSGIRVCFTVIVPPLKTGRMPVIDGLTLQKSAEQFLVPLISAFPFPSSMDENRPVHFALLIQKPADFLQIPGTGFLSNAELTEILLVQKRYGFLYLLEHFCFPFPYGFLPDKGIFVRTGFQFRPVNEYGFF